MKAAAACHGGGAGRGGGEERRRRSDPWRSTEKVAWRGGDGGGLGR